MKNDQILSVVFQRRSIRKFKSRPVPRNIIEKIVEAGQRAPTACGMQAYSFILVTDSKIRDQIFQAIGRQKCMEKAPVWIIVCADLARQLKLFKMLGIKAEYGKVSKLLSTVIDASLTIENIIIAAEALGLGSVCIGSVWSSMKKVAEILRLPRNVLPIVLVCLGYPNESPPSRPRWPLQAVLHENFYRMPSKELMKEYYEKSNSQLVKMKYFPRNISSWAEHWQRKFEPKGMLEWEKKVREDLQDLGFL